MLMVLTLMWEDAGTLVLRRRQYDRHRKMLKNMQELRCITEMALVTDANLLTQLLSRDLRILFTKKAFDSELAGKDWAKEASKAKSERHRKDVKNNTEKTARGVVNTVRGNGMYAGAAAFAIGTGITAYIRNKPKVDATIKGAFNNVVNKVNYAKAKNQAQDFFRRNGL